MTCLGSASCEESARRTHLSSTLISTTSLPPLPRPAAFFQRFIPPPNPNIPLPSLALPPASPCAAPVAVSEGVKNPNPSPAPAPFAYTLPFECCTELTANVCDGPRGGGWVTGAVERGREAAGRGDMGALCGSRGRGGKRTSASGGQPSAQSPSIASQHQAFPSRTFLNP